MKKINKITIKRILDTDTDISYLGTFSDEAGEYAVKHNGENGSYAYFNADNVENMEQAQENYDRAMEYENGNVCDYGVKAFAEIYTSNDGQNWLINKVSSGGLWGLSSDADEADFDMEASNQLDELTELLEELGFKKEDINKVKIDKENF